MRVLADNARDLALAYHAYLEALVYRKDENAIRHWGGRLLLAQQRTSIVMIRDLDEFRESYTEANAAGIAESDINPTPIQPPPVASPAVHRKVIENAIAF